MVIPTIQDLGDLTGRLLLEKGKVVKCEHLKADAIGPYCSNGLTGTEISERRRAVCEVRCLRIYCLDSSNYRICIWNNGESLE